MTGALSVWVARMKREAEEARMRSCLKQETPTHNDSPMRIDTYEMSSEGLTANINDGIDVFLTAMVNDGVLTAEQRTALDAYRVIVAKPTVWGRFWNYMTGKKDDDERARLYVVKCL